MVTHRSDLWVISASEVAELFKLGSTGIP